MDAKDSERRLSRVEVEALRGAVTAWLARLSEPKRGHGSLGRMGEMAHLPRDVLPLKGQADPATGGGRLLLRVSEHDGTESRRAMTDE